MKHVAATIIAAALVGRGKHVSQANNVAFVRLALDLLAEPVDVACMVDDVPPYRYTQAVLSACSEPTMYGSRLTVCSLSMPTLTVSMKLRNELARDSHPLRDEMCGRQMARETRGEQAARLVRA